MMILYFVKRHVKDRTKCCPKVAGLCPVFVPIVSIFGLILFRCGLTRRSTFRTGSNCFSGGIVKINDGSGAAVPLVRRVPVRDPRLAREPDWNQHKIQREPFKFNVFSFGDRSALKNGKGGF